MKWNVRAMCRTALLLALCVASQFLKNTSIFITGTAVNAILILATLSCGPAGGCVIALISPFTAWLITGNAVMTAIPLIPWGIALGNLVLVILVWLCSRLPGAWMAVVGMAVGSCFKALTMWLLLVKTILPCFGVAAGIPAAKLAVLASNYGLPQLITALLGSVVAFFVWTPLKKYLKNPEGSNESSCY